MPNNFRCLTTAFCSVNLLYLRHTGRCFLNSSDNIWENGQKKHTHTWPRLVVIILLSSWNRFSTISILLSVCICVFVHRLFYIFLLFHFCLYIIVPLCNSVMYTVTLYMRTVVAFTNSNHSDFCRSNAILTDYLITLVSVRVSVHRSVVERLRPQFLTDFHQILHAAQKCGCFERYCFSDKP